MCLVLVLSLLIISVSSIAVVAKDSDNLVIQVKNATATKGGKAVVTVSLVNNPGIAALSFSVSFDTPLLLESVTYSNGLGGESVMPKELDPNATAEVVPVSTSVKLNWVKNENYTEDGVFATLVFVTGSEIELGTYNVTVSDVVVTNIDETDVACSVAPGSVEIKDYIVGDVNGDMAVDIDDAIFLLYHIFFPDDSYYSIAQNCDFNKDGVVNIDDSIFLLYHVFFPDDPEYSLN